MSVAPNARLMWYLDSYEWQWYRVPVRPKEPQGDSRRTAVAEVLILCRRQPYEESCAQESRDFHTFQLDSVMIICSQL